MEKLQQSIEKERVVNLVIAFGWSLVSEEVKEGVVYLLIKKEIVPASPLSPP